MKRAGQSNVLLDEQAKKDAALIATHFNLRGISAAIRYALRETARRIEHEQAIGKVIGSTPRETIG